MEKIRRFTLAIQVQLAPGIGFSDNRYRKILFDKHALKCKKAGMETPPFFLRYLYGKRKRPRGYEALLRSEK